MDQKQYDAMQIITQCSRAFAEQMRKCMVNSGLVGKGFHLKVLVSPTTSAYSTYSEIELSEYITDVGEEQYKKTCMEQFRLGNDDWSVRHDPKAKAGTVPQNYGSKTAIDNGERVAEETRHPYPPDNLWISSRDDYPVLDGGQ